MEKIKMTLSLAWGFADSVMRSSQRFIIILMETEMYRILIVLVWKTTNNRVNSRTAIYITMRHMWITTAPNKLNLSPIKEKSHINGKRNKVEFGSTQLQSLKKWMYNFLPNVQQFMTVNVVKEFTLDQIFENYSSSQPLRTNDTMKYELLRIFTFHNYPDSNGQSAIRLAAAGFFYNDEGDNVECFSCKIKISKWHPENVPMIRHRELSPSCPFITNQNSGNVPISLSEHDSGYVSPGGTARTQDIADRNRAHYPDYVRDQDRLQSFNRGWPGFHVKQSPQTMVESGFFYAGYEDCVRCFQCGIGLRSWKPSDNPHVEHARWSPKCPYLLSAKGQDFINLVLDAIAQLTERNEQSDNTAQTPTESPPVNAASLQTSTENNPGNALPLQTPTESPTVNAAPLQTPTESNPGNASPLQTPIESDPGNAVPLQIPTENNPGNALPLQTPTESPPVNAAPLQTPTESNPGNASPLQTPIESDPGNAVPLQIPTESNPGNAAPLQTPTENNPGNAAPLQLPTESNPGNAALLQTSRQSHWRSTTARNPTTASARPNRVLAFRVSIKSPKSSPTAAHKASEIMELKNKNKELREMTMCKICVVEEVSIVFIPCGHLVVCTRCAPGLTNCLVCREPISSTTQAYLT